MSVTTRRARRASFATAAACSLALIGGSARASEPAASVGPCGAPSSVSVQVAPFADRRVSRKLERAIASELEAPRCWPLAEGGEALSIGIEVRWPERTRARLVIVVITPHRVHHGIRDLDLQKLPDDGIPLAVAIATDELLGAISEQIAHEPVTAPAPLAPPMEPSSSPAPHSSHPPRQIAFGPAAGLDLAGSGLVLVGPDAQMLVPFTSGLALALRVGPRAFVDPRAHAPLRLSSAWVAGATLRIGPQTSRAGFAVSTGVDALAMRIHGERESAFEGLAVARVGLASFATLAPGLRLTAEAYVGGAFSPVRAKLGSKSVETFGGGMATGGAFGIAALF